MDNNQLNELMTGIGLVTELWTITYLGFTKQGLSAPDALMHTKAFMSVIIEDIMGLNNKETKNDPS